MSRNPPDGLSAPFYSSAHAAQNCVQCVPCSQQFGFLSAIDVSRETLSLFDWLMAILIVVAFLLAAACYPN